MFSIHCSIQHEIMDPSPVKAHLYSLPPRDDNVSVPHYPQNNSTLFRGVWGGMNCRTNVIRQADSRHRLFCAGRMFLSVRTRWQDLPSAPPPIHTSRVQELKSHTGHSGSGLTDQILQCISLGPVTPVFWAIWP